MKKLILLFFLNISLFAPLVNAQSDQCTIIMGRDKPAADDPDVNLRQRSWVDSTETNKNLIDVGGPTDDLAPQFSTIVGNSPNIVGMYQINLWDWSTNTRAGPIPKDENSNWGVTLLELGTNEVIRAPKSGYEITSTGYKYTVLYADASTITIKGTLEDNAISGYTIHFVDLNVNPEIVTAYDLNEASGRKQLVAMPCGYELGTPRDSKFKLAIADTGTFIDPRVRKDWWHAPANDSCASLPLEYVDTLPTEICPTNRSTKKGPLAEGFKPLDYPCDRDTGFKKEYHPLRPYPGSPCDPLIPRSIPEAPSSPEKKFNTFACGTSLTPSAIERFDPYGKNGAYENLPLVEGYAHTICEPREGTAEFAAIARSGGTVTCWRTSAFDITVDLSQANVGILGNTQDNSLTDAQKVNEYLSWYLTGTPQIGDQIPLNKNKPEDINRLINFSGPLRKLLSFDSQKTLRETVASADDEEVHNYIAGENFFGLDTVRLDRYSRFGGVLNETFLRKIFQNVPLSSLEDTTGEFTMSVFRDPSFDQQVDSLDNPQYSPIKGVDTAPLKLIIKSAQKAGE